MRTRIIRQLLATTFCSLTANLICLGTATAQTYPTRQITMMVPFGAGGSTDIVGRITAQAMAKNLGVPVVVLNKGGVGGTLGTQQATTMPAREVPMGLPQFGSSLQVWAPSFDHGARAATAN